MFLASKRPNLATLYLAEESPATAPAPPSLGGRFLERSAEHIKVKMSETSRNCAD